MGLHSIVKLVALTKFGITIVRVSIRPYPITMAICQKARSDKSSSKPGLSRTTFCIIHVNLTSLALDCFLIHGSSLSVSDEFTPSIDLIHRIDRRSRIDVNQLFCRRSGLAFEYQIESGSLNSQVQTLDKLIDRIPTILSPRRIVEVVSASRVEGKVSYLFYHPEIDKLEFKTVRYVTKKDWVENV